MLQAEEQKRYNRHLILPGFGLQGQEKLKGAKVLMIGAGGLGCPVLQYLAAAGVGEIGIVDDDVVDISNLQRQILYSTEDVGKKKAEIAAEKLLKLNPFTKVTPFTESITAQNAEVIVDPYDLIIDGSDNFPTRYLVNDICVLLDKPLVFGSIFKFEGQVSVFNYKGGPTYRCVFPEPPAPNEVPNCSEIGVIGVLPGIIGIQMANEVIKLIAGIGETLSGKLLILNALDNTTLTLKVNRTAEADKVTLASHIKPTDSCNAPNKVQEVNLKDLEQWLEEKPEEIYLVDVREPEEFEAYSIGGVNIPLDDLSAALENLPKDKKVIFCCQTGQRSLKALELAQKQFSGLELYHLKGGIL